MTDRSDRAGGDGRCRTIENCIKVIALEVYPDPMMLEDFSHNDKCRKAIQSLNVILDVVRASPPSGNAGEGATDCEQAGCAEVVGDLPDPRWDQGQCSVCKKWFHKTAPPQPAPDALREALMDAVLHLEYAHSGFISGCGSDTAWLNKRDEIVNAARAALSTPLPSGEHPNADQPRK